MKSFYTIKFLPENKEIQVLEGASLLFAAIKAGITINTPCGGKGICGKCRVVILPAPPPTPQEKRILSEKEIEKGWRLSCQHQVTCNLKVEIPSSSRYFRQVILTKMHGGKVSLSPPVKRVSFPMPSLSLGERSIGEKVLPPHLHLDLYSLRHLAQSFKKGRAFSSVVNAHQVLEVKQEGNLLGIAFDIGTTTVVGYLVNLESGEMIDVHAITNPQVIYGDDVISRIEYAAREDGLKDLSQAILGGINTIIKELCKKNQLSPEEIFELSVAGNSAMLHLLLSVDTSSLARIPFVPVWRSSLYFPARELGIKINKRGWVYLLPLIASFVGADTSGVILSTRIDKLKGIRLAVDIGTNGEMILSVNGKLTVTSTAAGPAFEGARISRGMRSEIGAIDGVKIKQGMLELNVIGGAKPRGICGTGVVDAVSELLRVGILDETGRIKTREELQGKIPSSLLARVRKGAFALVEGEGEILITQKDVRELQLAKGAIRAGMKVLLQSKGYQEKDLDQLILAGGFGNYVRKSSARRIGLIPPVKLEKVKVVGNAAGAGSYITLLSLKSRKELEKLVERVEYIELGNKPEFMEEFTSSMYFAGES